MLNFDSWQRCETVKHLINWALPDPGKLLDVGGYPGRMRAVLPQHEWVLCDPLVDSPGEQLKGSALNLPFRDEAFDFVTCLDVLEHIPPDHRAMVLEEIVRVSRQGMVLSFPYKHPLVEAAEKQVREVYEKGFDRPHPWLAEHAEYDLPDAETIAQQLLEFGGQVAIFNVGALDRWVYLQLVDILLEIHPNALDLAKQLDTWYEENLYVHEFKAPTYRKILLHLFYADEPLNLNMVDTPREEEMSANMAFHQKVTLGLLDLAAAFEPEPEPIPEPEPEPQTETVEATEETEAFISEAAPEPVEEPEDESIAPSQEDAYREYVTRLEQGLQAWEETYTATMQEMTDAQRWRNQLEQRKSFKIYKRIMRMLGKKIEP